MAVRQLADGRWTVYYRVKDEHGASRVRWEYFGRGPQAEARAYRRQGELGLAKRCPAAAAAGPTFYELAKAYSQRRGPNPNSRLQLQIRLEAHLIPAFGPRMALQLRPSDVAAYVDRREADGVKPATIARELTDLKAIYSWAAGQSRHEDRPDPPLIPLNPIAGVKKPRVRVNPSIPPTTAEALRILGAAQEHVRRAITLSWYIGLRPGAVELLSLRWDAVDWKNGTVMVTSAHKGGPESRSVPIHPELLPQLEAWRAADRARKYKPKRPEAGVYVVHYGGRRVKSIGRAWRSALERARIGRPLRPYDLRHHFVTRALEEGADLGALSKIVGSSPATLLKYYQHVATPHTRRTVALIPNLEADPKKPRGYTGKIQPTKKRKTTRNKKKIKPAETLTR
jgi:integrase